MRCKAHPYAHGVGVCAPCLRERLLALVATASAAEDDDGDNEAPPAPSRRTLKPHRPSSPPLLVAPRSVSPYVPRRRSDASAPAPCRNPSLLFFRTPQVGPSVPAGAEDGGGGVGGGKSRSGKFSILNTLFGHSRPTEPSRSTSRSTSWLSALVRGGRRRRRRRSKTPEVHSPALTSPSSMARRSSYRAARDRGMSPESESPGAGERWWHPTPSPLRRASHHRAAAPGGGAGISGFAVCLSPLVRPSPSHRRSQGSAAPAGDMGFSGELRSARSPRHHRRVSGSGFAAPSALCHNRSRKLADFGRLR
ncbi:hypothetical protein ACMD2_07975 [Ananas comosus]|uniref:Uncharacterized protein n=1 Tax=Ananas comosus TaxID=4615 RepID=A0A199V384_ANACO|nr:hypothetical protein ACMD2_07975 [Ananas comosus]